MADANSIREELRTAIKGCQVVTIKYRTRSTGKVSQRKVYPYGFLYGHRHYLVAYNLRKDEEGFRLFSLPNIYKVEITTEYFERDGFLSNLVIGPGQTCLRFQLILIVSYQRNL